MPKQIQYFLCLINQQKMRKSLVCMIVVVVLLIQSRQQDSSLSNLYFDSLRTGRVPFTASGQVGPRTQFFTAAFQSPFADSAAVECHVALSSFSIPFDLNLENIVSVPQFGCMPININISLTSSPKNTNIVSYIVVSGDLIASPNFITLSLQSQLIGFKYGKPITQAAGVNSINSSGEIKHFSFFQGFKLQNINALNQSLFSQRGFEIVINQITSDFLNYSILILGENTFSGTITALVIAYNNDFFNSGNALMFVDYSKDFSNLTDGVITLELSTDFQEALFFVGLNKVYADGDIVFSLEANETEQISVHSNGGLNSFQASALVFPKRVAKNLKKLKKTSNNKQGAGADSQNNTNPSDLLIYLTVLGSIAVSIIDSCYQRSNQRKTNQSDYIQQPTAAILPAKGFVLSSITKESVKKQICVSCYSKKIELIKHCKHCFHIKCCQQQLSSIPNCPACRKLMKNQQLTVFCKKCWLGYEARFQQIMQRGFAVEKVCQDCKNKTTSHQSQLKDIQYPMNYIGQIAD